MTTTPPPGRNGNAADIDYLISFFPDVPGSPAFPREVMSKKTGGQVQVSSKKDLPVSEGWKPYLHPREGYSEIFFSPQTGQGEKKKLKNMPAYLASQHQKAQVHAQRQTQPYPPCPPYPQHQQIRIK